MKFEEIPKRSEKGQYTSSYGRRRRLWNLTNRLGNSPILNVVITIGAPIISGLFVSLLFFVYLFFVKPIGVESFFDFIVLMIIISIIQAIILWILFIYIGYIAFMQIKYDINRITGIMSFVFIVLSFRSTLFIFSLLSLGAGT